MKDDLKATHEFDIEMMVMMDKTNMCLIVHDFWVLLVLAPSIQDKMQQTMYNMEIDFWWLI